MMSAPCGAFCVCCVLSCYFLWVSLRLSTLTQEFGQTSFADCISTLSSSSLFLWHRAKEKRGSFGQAITSSSLGFVRAQGTESAFTVPITKPLSSCPLINTIHQQPPSNLPACPKEQPKWKPFLAWSLSVLLLLQEEDPWGKWGSIFSPGQCLSTYTRTCLSITLV